MKTIHLNASNLTYWTNQSTPNVMALGFFDGVHHGHKKVIQTAANIANEKNVALTVMSFFPHPKTVLSKTGEQPFHYLMPLSKKASILESLGVDTFYVVTFDKDFLSLLPEQFVSKYLLDMNVVHVVAGFDFSYGYRRTGHIDRLRRDAKNKIDVTKVDKVDFGGKKISSTWIRELISHGKMDKLSKILGRYYETEVQWNGKYLQLSPYYMLPASGYYKVILSKKNKLQEETEVFIPESDNGIYLLKNTKHQFFFKEKCKITWIRQMSMAHTLHSTNASII